MLSRTFAPFAACSRYYLAKPLDFLKKKLAQRLLFLLNHGVLNHRATELGSDNKNRGSWLCLNDSLEP